MRALRLYVMIPLIYSGLARTLGACVRSATVDVDPLHSSVLGMRIKARPTKTDSEDPRRRYSTAHLQHLDPGRVTRYALYHRDLYLRLVFNGWTWPEGKDTRLPLLHARTLTFPRFSYSGGTTYPFLHRSTISTRPLWSQTHRYPQEFCSILQEVFPVSLTPFGTSRSVSSRFKRTARPLRYLSAIAKTEVSKIRHVEVLIFCGGSVPLLDASSTNL